MNTNNALSQPQIIARSRPFRSLFYAVAGALLLTAAVVPKANADLLIYFNFEDAVTNGVPDFNSDQQPAFGGDNPGGGIQASTLTLSYSSPSAFYSSPGLLLNRSAGDIDIANPGQALTLTRSGQNNGSYLQFPVDAQFFTNMSLCYATNNNGNGFTTQTLQYSINGGVTFTTFATFTGLTGTQLISANLPAGADGQFGLVVRILFSGGQSNGVDVQTIIDNIQLKGSIIPEPATVAGGLLGVCGLCWHQRRRLINSLRFRRA